MNKYRHTLKKVGIALIIVGILDIAMMVYCIINRISYSSSFNIFAVIAGIFLYSGGLKTALFVSWVSAFFLCATVGSLLIIPEFIPFDLMITYLKLSPSVLMRPLFFGILFFSFILWIYKNLTAPHVFKAMDENNINRKSRWKRPTTGFIAGGCLIVLLIIIVPSLIGGETVDQAIIKAQEIVGDGYKFTVSHVNVKSTFGGATQIQAQVIAYNDNEIRPIPIRWEK
jgi:hypothetical protein